MRAHRFLAANACAISRASSARTARAAHSSFDISFLSRASCRPTGALGLALVAIGDGVGAHPKGEQVLGIHAFTFVQRRPGHQPGRRLNFSTLKGPALIPTHMQREFSLLARIDAPSIVPPEFMRLAQTYREAVRLCLHLAKHRRPGLKVADIAAECNLNRRHASDYFIACDKATRRSLPAEAVQAVELFLQNTAITQWHAARAKFTVLEELQAGRAAA